MKKRDDKGTPAFSEFGPPVFRTHDDTGKKAIYVNRLMTEGVIDMEQDWADGLLNALFDHSESPEFVYAEWQAGDLLLWDNRCSMHARTDFPRPNAGCCFAPPSSATPNRFRKHPRMPKILAEEQIAAWHSDGCIFPHSRGRPGLCADEFRPTYRAGKEDRRGTAKPVQNQGTPSIPLDVGHHPQRQHPGCDRGHHRPGHPVLGLLLFH